MSQKDLAEKADISPSFLCLLEADKREPSLACVRRIADELSVPIDVLIWDAVDVPSSLSEEDRRQCEIAKSLVDRFFANQADDCEVS